MGKIPPNPISGLYPNQNLTTFLVTNELQLSQLWNDNVTWIHTYKLSVMTLQKQILCSLTIRPKFIEKWKISKMKNFKNEKWQVSRVPKNVKIHSRYNVLLQYMCDCSKMYTCEMYSRCTLQVPLPTQLQTRKPKRSDLKKGRCKLLTNWTSAMKHTAIHCTKYMTQCTLTYTCHM